MKLTTKILGILISLLMANYLFAADIGLIGLRDFDFGNIAPEDKNIHQEQKICVYSVPNGRYQLTMLAEHPGQNEFDLTNQDYHVPVSIIWNGVELKPGVPMIFAGAAATEQTQNCENVTLKSRINSGVTPKVAGLYLQHLHFELVNKN